MTYRVVHQTTEVSMRKSFSRSIACLFLIAIGSLASAQSSQQGKSVLPPVAANAASSEGVIVGTNIVNPYGLNDTKQNVMLSQTKADGVRVLRVITRDKAICRCRRWRRSGSECRPQS